MFLNVIRRWFWNQDADGSGTRTPMVLEPGIRLSPSDTTLGLFRLHVLMCSWFSYIDVFLFGSYTCKGFVPVLIFHTDWYLY